MKFIYVALLCTALAIRAMAFDTDRAMQTITVLASDQFEGRRSGLPGGHRAEQFVASELTAAGILPAGWDSTYFQKVPMLVTREESAALTLMDSPFGKVQFTYGDDFTLVTHSGSGAFIAPAVLVGYGIVRPDKGRDDYGDLDVRGRAVVIVRKEFKHPAWDFRADFPRGKLISWAQERGATAILFYQQSLPVQGAAVSEEVYDPRVPIYYVGDRVMRLLLRDTGYTLDSYLTSLADTANHLDVRKRLWVSARVSKIPEGSARNVLGFIYGADSELRGEIVAIGAHLDHLGPNGQGLIYNGADDNASGCGLVLELARSIAQDPTSPKRSLMVFFFAGEEDGLIGSRWFTAHPTVPLGRIVAMLNFDMVGQGNGAVGMAGGELLGPAWDDYRERLTSEDTENLRIRRTSATWYGDYGPFHRVGIPAISFWSSGDHPFYHQYEDDAVYIDREIIHNVGERAEHFLRYLINDCPPLLSKSDSLRTLIRMSTRLDWTGLGLFEAPAYPELLTAPGIHLVWLPNGPFVPTWTLVESMARLQRTCEAKQIECGSLPKALEAYNHQQSAVVFGVSAQALVACSREDVDILFQQGIGVIDLGETHSTHTGLDQEIVSAARNAGIFALMPIDYGTPQRIRQWRRHAIVRDDFGELSQLPQQVRDSLMQSSAVLLMTVEGDLDSHDIDALRPWVERTVCLDPGPLLERSGEHAARRIVSRLYEAGLSRDEIILLLRENLHRLIH